MKKYNLPNKGFDEKSGCFHVEVLIENASAVL